MTPSRSRLRSRPGRRAALAAGTSMALTVLGLTAAAGASPAAADPAPGAASVTAGGIPRLDHVVVVMEENKYYEDVMDSSSAPYINSLAKQGASFKDFHGITHPSQGNYVALFSGSTHGIADDDCPHDFSSDNLGNQLLTHGGSFTGYSEDLPADGSKDCGDDGDSGYARKHNGWVDFKNVPASSNLRMDRFPSDYAKLPDVAFVTPNLDDDMHDGTVREGDDWLRDHLDGYVQWAKTHNSALVVTWDEDDSDDDVNHIPTVIVGAHVKQGYTSTKRGDLYSLLRTLEDMHGLPALGSAADRDPLTDVWDTGGTTPPPTDGTNLAANRPTKTSSTESSGLTGAKAVDGDSGTRWASKEGSDPQWISVDLGADTDISRVKLSWEAAFGKAYRIQTSQDGSTWSTVYSTTSGNGGTDDLTVHGHGRYVRMYGTQRGTSYGYSLYEFQVYGTGGTTTPPPPTSGGDLNDPAKKEIAMELVSSAENSSLDWKAQYTYIEDIGDGRGYTAGIIGFCSGTGDMLDLVEHYTDLEPGNVLAKYLPALRDVNGSDSHAGLGSAFVSDWHKAAGDSVFRKAQDDERDRVYFDPAVEQAKADGVQTLGQFIYYDAIVMHGPGDDDTSFGGIRARAMRNAKTPAQGGDEVTYLNAFLDARKWAMEQEEAHSDTSRVDTEQRVFLDDGNLQLNPPLRWKVYGDPYEIDG